jgi:hypothetical protein
VSLFQKNMHFKSDIVIKLLIKFDDTINIHSDRGPNNCDDP